MEGGCRVETGPTKASSIPNDRRYLGSHGARSVAEKRMQSVDEKYRIGMKLKKSDEVVQRRCAETVSMPRSIYLLSR